MQFLTILQMSQLQYSNTNYCRGSAPKIGRAHTYKNKFNQSVSLTLSHYKVSQQNSSPLPLNKYKMAMTLHLTQMQLKNTK